MKNSEIKELTTKEIAERIDAEKEKLTRMRLNHAVSPLDNPMLLKEARKNIARLNTEMRQRQLTENK
ncbi:MAG: 50S ribosomal protein L29 [Prolixibacteraceae bacterium]|jgi:large subunit ribosomal protein L29|nr:50S ribosomal protein L29 [Prolixibacteraceae bacterium]HOO84423.1 50S ribosomal protein L29 [Prolixibacteraceae bacterium]HPR59477.1 50S ribosomal protein L29 [Prolixibacteraceae bacterium]